MAAIDFPLNPTPGQQFTSGGVTWTFDGTKWTALANTVGIPDAPKDGTTYGRNNGSWVPASGGSGGIADAPVDGTAYARKNLTWANLTHADITDWTATLANYYSVSNPAGYQTAAQVTAALVPYALATSIPAGSNTNPLANGTAAPGTSIAFARADHVHPGGGGVPEAPNDEWSYTRSQNNWVSTPTFTGNVSFQGGGFNNSTYLTCYPDPGNGAGVVVHVGTYPNDEQWSLAYGKVGSNSTFVLNWLTQSNFYEFWTADATAGTLTFGRPVIASKGISAQQAIGDNRIINGDMRIDQRNNGASGTAVGYTVDRWLFSASLATKGAWQRLATIAPGFPYALTFISSSAYTPAAGDYFMINQPIEADMVSDFQWGTANAQPITLSFYAQSSLTGTFGGSVKNAAGTRSYPFSYSLPTVGVPTKVAITIPGDTAGTWVMSGNAAALYVLFDLGVGSTYRGPAGAWAGTTYNGATGAVSVVATNGASFGVTGVKLEIGSIATPFNRQSLAKSMADCQRYYETSGGGLWTGQVTTGLSYYTSIKYSVQKRASPTMTAIDLGNTGFPAGTPSLGGDATFIQAAKAANATSGQGYFSFSWTANAEL